MSRLPKAAAWADAMLPLSLLPLLLQRGEQPIGMALVILAWLGCKLLQRKESEPFNWLFAFLLATQLQPILSSDKYPASTFSDLLLPVTAFVAGFRQDRRSWYRALAMIMAIIPMAFLILRPEIIGPGTTPILTLIGVNRNRTAFLLGITTVLAACLCSQCPDPRRKTGAAAIGGLGYLGCLATGSRAGAILPLIATGLALWANRTINRSGGPTRAPKAALKPVFIAGAILALVTATLLSWYSPLSPNPKRNQLSDYGRIAMSRCFVEQAGRSADTLLRGIGQGKDKAAKLCRDSTPWARKGKGLAHAHNNFVQLLAENGLPALLLAIGLLATAAKTAWRNLRSAISIEDRMLATASIGILAFIFLYSFADGTLIRLPLQQVLQGYLLALPFAPAATPAPAPPSQA